MRTLQKLLIHVQLKGKKTGKKDNLKENNQNKPEKGKKLHFIWGPTELFYITNSPCFTKNTKWIENQNITNTIIKIDENVEFV